MGMQAAVQARHRRQLRDTDEVIIEDAGSLRRHRPSHHPRPSRPVDLEVPIAAAAFVRPGDIVGCDWDGCIVVPLEIAEDVLVIAARISVDDRKGRRRLYEKLGKQPDETVDWEACAEYCKDIL
jgi:regulator of RNase E activity RraA